jgi:hypothetical protein
MQDTTNTIAERTSALAEHRARLDTLYARYERNAAGTARDAIAIGGELVAIEALLGAEKYGNWEKWVKENCKFDVRTARRIIQAYEMRFDAILSVDPVEFMRRVWGNEGPKAKKEKNGLDVTSEVDSEGGEGSDVTSEAQSGGSKFNAPLTSAKGQAALNRFRALVKEYESDFFGSLDYTRSAKARLAGAIMMWADNLVERYPEHEPSRLPLSRPRMAGGFPPIEIPTQKAEN